MYVCGFGVQETAPWIRIDASLLGEEVQLGFLEQCVMRGEYSPCKASSVSAKEGLQFHSSKPGEISVLGSVEELFPYISEI